MGKKFSCYPCFLILYLFCTVFSTLAGEQQNQMELSLRDCILLALKSNLDMQIQSINPKIQDASIAMAKGNFDPSMTFGPVISSSNEPSSSQSVTETGARSGRGQGVAIGITDPIVTGTRYGVSLSTNRSESDSTLLAFNPSYSTKLTLSVTQPLLKGFGTTVNRSSIVIANNNKDISIFRLKSQLIRTLSEVQFAYWELVYAIENLKVQQLSLQQAQNLLSINQKFKELNKATTSDVLQAQAAVASREADVIAATDSVKEAEDNLKRITNIIQDETQWDKQIIPLDLPSFEEVSLNLQEDIGTALKNRPEYAQAKLDLQNSDIYVKVAQNQRLPALDLEGSFAFSGLGGEIGDPFSQMRNADYQSWTTSLALRMPIGGRTTKSSLKKTQLEREQKRLTLKDLEQQIVTEVRNSVRRIETDRKRIEATEKAENFAKQVLATEEKKYNLGLSTSYDLLQFQANLATAARNRLRAVIDYRKSMVSLYQSKGVTLDKLNVELKYE